MHRDVINEDLRDLNRDYKNVKTLDNNCAICEHNDIIRPAQIKDHCLPHSCGGPTNEKNLLFLCWGCDDIKTRINCSLMESLPESYQKELNKHIQPDLSLIREKLMG